MFGKKLKVDFACKTTAKQFKKKAKKSEEKAISNKTHGDIWYTMIYGIYHGFG